MAKKLDAHEDVKILKTYDSDVFKGLSIESGEHNLDTLNEVAEVEQAWPASYIELPTIEVQELGKISNAANYSVHQTTGVDKVHAAGYRGKGVKVAVVDTGVDYNHPAVSLLFFSYPRLLMVIAGWWFWPWIQSVWRL